MSSTALLGTIGVVVGSRGIQRRPLQRYGSSWLRHSRDAPTALHKLVQRGEAHGAPLTHCRPPHRPPEAQISRSIAVHENDSEKTQVGGGVEFSTRHKRLDYVSMWRSVHSRWTTPRRASPVASSPSLSSSAVSPVTHAEPSDGRRVHVPTAACRTSQTARHRLAYDMRRHLSRRPPALRAASAAASSEPMRSPSCCTLPPTDHSMPRAARSWEQGWPACSRTRFACG